MWHRKKVTASEVLFGPMRTTDVAARDFITSLGPSGPVGTTGR
jgi:hypothetical protein